jgi:hypothetical protein
MMVMCATDPTGTGPRMAMPSKRPSYRGGALIVAIAAPVEVGTKLTAAVRPRRRVVAGPSTIPWRGGVGVDRRHKRLLQPDAAPKHLDHRCDGVRRAIRRGDDRLAVRLVDDVNDDGVDLGCRRHEAQHVAGLRFAHADVSRVALGSRLHAFELRSDVLASPTPAVSSASVLPPKRWTTRETLTPPPPGSASGLVQRGFGPTANFGVVIQRSMARFGVSLTIVSDINHPRPAARLARLHAIGRPVALRRTTAAGAGSATPLENRPDG